MLTGRSGPGWPVALDADETTAVSGGATARGLNMTNEDKLTAAVSDLRGSAYVCVMQRHLFGMYVSRRVAPTA
jgi:hypothetical protein